MNVQVTQVGQATKLQKPRKKFFTLGAGVSMNTYALFREQARLEGVNMSVLLGQLVVRYLKKQNTTIRIGS